LTGLRPRVYLEAVIDGVAVAEGRLGDVTQAHAIPIWLLTLNGDVMLDRMSRRPMLVVTAAGMRLLAFILDRLTILLGIAHAFDAFGRSQWARGAALSRERLRE
jgi:hypothetical protein